MANKIKEPVAVKNGLRFISFMAKLFLSFCQAASPLRGFKDEHISSYCYELIGIIDM